MRVPKAVGTKVIVVSKRPSLSPVCASKKCVSAGTRVKPTEAAMFFSVSTNASFSLKCFRNTVSLSTITKLAPTPITAPALKLTKNAPTPPVAKYPEAMTPVVRRATPMRPTSCGIDARSVIAFVHGSKGMEIAVKHQSANRCQK